MNIIDNLGLNTAVSFGSSHSSLLYYFGYGANRSKERIAEIFGRIPSGGYGGIIEGYVLTFQSLIQLPPEPKSILEKVWGDTFRAYTIQPGKGLVAGVVWELSEPEVVKLKQWEFEGIWRDFIDVVVKTSDGRTIHTMTDLAKSDQQVKHIVDGLYYHNNLNSQGKKRSKDEYRIQDTKRARKMLEDIVLATNEDHK